MRLCGRMGFGQSLVAVEINYLTYDDCDDDGTDLGPGVRLRAVDTNEDLWFVYNVPQEEADNIIETITRQGWVTLPSNYTLMYIFADVFNEDGIDNDEVDLK